MRYSLRTIFQDAVADDTAVCVDGDGYQSRLLHGTKISKDNESDIVVIQNTSLGGDYYKDIDGEDEYVFLSEGWRIGVYKLCLKTYKKKLDKIEERIRDEMNSKQNPKQIQYLKSNRERIMGKYNYINNKLKSESYE